MMGRKKALSQSDETQETSSVSRKPTTALIKKKVSPLRATSRPGNKTSTTSVMSQNGSPSDPPDLHARIADRAYELYTHRGGHHGMDLEDWFNAERQVLDEGC